MNWDRRDVLAMQADHTGYSRVRSFNESTYAATIVACQSRAATTFSSRPRPTDQPCLGTKHTCSRWGGGSGLVEGRVSV